MKYSLHSFLSAFSPTWVVSRMTSLDRWPDCLVMGLVPPHLLWEDLQVSTFPQGMGWVSVTDHGIPQWYLGRVLQHMVPCTSEVCDGFAHCQVLACQQHWICHTFAAVSLQKETIFVQLFVLAICWPTYASCWYCFIAGWLVMSWSCSASHQ